VLHGGSQKIVGTIHVLRLRACIAFTLVIPVAACSGAGSSTVPGAGAMNRARLYSTAAATASPAASPAVPLHIPTMAIDEYGTEGENASSASVNQYVSYAEGGLGNDKATVDCDSGSAKNCLSVFYMDPNFLYDSAQCPSAEATSVTEASDESWFVHEAGYTDFAHRVQGSYSQDCNGASVTVPVYLFNDANSSVISYFESYMQSVANSWDVFFMDDTSARVLTQTYGPGGGFCRNNPPTNYCTTTEEYPTDASVAAAHVTFASGMNHTNGDAMKFMFNGVGFSGSTVENLDILSGSSRYIAAVCENCILNANVFRPTMYANVLSAMAQIDQIPGAAFVELNTGFEASGSPEEQHDRVTTTAVAWLGYSPGQTIVFPNLEDTTTNLAVWPEDAIVPTQPLQSMTSSAGQIEVSPGVYLREFAQCYDAGVAIGQCAAVLNSNTSAATIEASWLKQKYTHILEMSGGDIESGGTISLTKDFFVPGISEVQASWGQLLLK
jgi:hypothetical protein